MFRWLAAVVLLPMCIAVTWVDVDLLSLVGRASPFWIPVVAGAGAWVVVFLSLPKPMWIYVVGHELTHALWVILVGGRVRGFKASSRGGHVVVTKSNLLITLSPYFFPLYATLWVLFFVIGDAIFGWRQWLPWFHFGLGVAYAFHVTLTIYILRTRQPDLESEGWVLSAVVIWLGNALILLVALPLLTRVVPIVTTFEWVLRRLARLIDTLNTFAF